MIISHYPSPPYLDVIAILLLSFCHFLEQRALLFRLFTAISSADVQEPPLFHPRGTRLSGRLRIQSHLLSFPSVRDRPALGSRRDEQRAFIRRPSANSADRFAAMMTTGSADTLVDALTHFMPSSVILVVPDGIDSLRNDETTSNRVRSISSTATRVGNSRSLLSPLSRFFDPFAIDVSIMQ